MKWSEQQVRVIYYTVDYKTGKLVKTTPLLTMQVVSQGLGVCDAPYSDNEWADKDKYVVYHVPTGLKLCVVKSETHAKKIVSEILKNIQWKELIEDIKTMGPQTARNHVKGSEEWNDLKDYCKFCTKLGQYIGPSQYRACKERMW